MCRIRVQRLLFCVFVLLFNDFEGADVVFVGAANVDWSGSYLLNGKYICVWLYRIRKTGLLWRKNALRLCWSVLKGSMIVA